MLTLKKLAPTLISALILISSARPVKAVKLFVTSNISNEVYRYEISQFDTPTLDLTLTASTLDRPVDIAFSPSLEMFVINRGSAVGGGGSIALFSDPTNSPISNGAITNGFNFPHGVVVRDNNMFVVNSYNNEVLQFNSAGQKLNILNSKITGGLSNGEARFIGINPAGNELFVSQCCSQSNIVRYRLDSTGNPRYNGIITGGGLDNPHEIAFSPWGEMFVANLNGNSISRFIFDSDGKALFNGLITGNGLQGPIGLSFSPWGELFAANHVQQGISRWLFDPTGNAIANGFFSTPTPLGSGLEFVPEPVTQSIPEPYSTLGLLAFGTFGASCLRKRKRQQKVLDSRFS